jgi:hypothetical protein
MNKPYEIFEGIDAQTFLSVAGIDVPHSEAYWIRYKSYCSDIFLDAIKNGITSGCAYVCLIDDDSEPCNPNAKNRIFLGAFGKSGLLLLNKNRAHRSVLSREGVTNFVDYCKVTSETYGDLRMFIDAIFRPKAGFFLLAENEISRDVLEKISQSILTGNAIKCFIEEVLGNNVLLGLPVENNDSTRSIVFLGIDVNKMLPRIFYQSDVNLLEAASFLELIRIFGDRWVGKNKLENITRNNSRCG